MRAFEYFINLFERGEFSADVRDENGSTVFEIEGFDLIEDGFMAHTEDLNGLRDHLTQLGIMQESDKLTKAN